MVYQEDLEFNAMIAKLNFLLDYQVGLLVVEASTPQSINA